MGRLFPLGPLSSIAHPEVVDPQVGDLMFDPVESGVVAGTVFLLGLWVNWRSNIRVIYLQEVGEIGHPTELVQVR